MTTTVIEQAPPAAPHRPRPQPALGSPDFWAEELLLTKNAFDAFMEFGDLDGLTSAFLTVLDAAWGLVAEHNPEAPLRAPWRNGGDRE